MITTLPPTIRRGDRGPAVAQWRKLMGLPAGDLFDEATYIATIEWQTEHRLTADGVVGQKQSWPLALGNQLVQRPLFGAMPRWKRDQIFGAFDWTDDDGDGYIKIPGAWDEQNIRTEVIEQLKGVPGCNAKGLVTAHKLALPAMRRFFEDIEQEGLLDRVKSFGGAYVPRRIRTLKGFSPNLSVHAWGCAFDINAAWNGLGQKPAERGAEGCVIELLPAAYTNGFYWGGLFGTADGMHFQFDNPPAELVKAAA